MSDDGQHLEPAGLFDQEARDEGGYLTDARVRLPRFGTGGRRPPPKTSLPLGKARGSIATRSDSVARHPSSKPQPGPRPIEAPNRGGIVVPLLILLVSLAGLAYVGYDRYLADSAVEPTAEPALAAGVATPEATTALFVQTDGSGASVGFTMISLHDSGEAAMVFVPASLMIEVPGIGLDTLVSATRLGGIDLSSLALENLLTVGFDHVVELTPADLTELTRTFDPLLVENPRRLDRATDRDRVEVLYPAGALLLEASQAADYLARRSIGETELQRLVRHQEFWVSLLDARSAVVADELDVADNVDDFLDGLATRADSVEYRILEVDLIGGDGDLYGIDRDYLDDVIVRLDPGRSEGDVIRTRVQLLNGVGIPGLAAPIARLINPAYASVELVDNAARFDHDVTQVVYYRDEQRGAAVAIRDALGVGDVVKQIEPIDVVDITVVVGSDLASVVAIETTAAEVIEAG
ncbi:MAG: LCP family protein [Actinomycetia bacterium]|nr:LCP family protein [Actinomycetes bacterium]